MRGKLTLTLLFAGKTAWYLFYESEPAARYINP